MNRCPTSEELRQYLERGLDATMEQVVADHVENCAECESALSSMLDRDGPTPADAQPGRERMLKILSESPLPPMPPDADEAELESAASLTRELGAYRLLRKLGSGGFGTVYLAEDARLRRLVAIKVLEGLVIEPLDRRRFEREGQAAAKVDHESVVRIIDVGQAPDLPPYLVMEWVEGPSLAAELKEQGAIAPAKAAEWARDIARGLAAVHSSGLIHRDVKSSNILIDRKTGRVKLTDFGLARSLAPAQSALVTRHVAGTAAYMSPEQFLGGQLDRRSDLYGLGVVLFEMLTGQRPFGGVEADIKSQVLMDDPPAIRARNRGISRDLETITRKCLAKRPAERYATAQELADDLQAFLEGRPIQARPVNVAVRLFRWCRRRPALASSITLATAIVVGSVGAALYRAEARAESARKDATIADEQRRRADEEAARIEAEAKADRERAEKEAARARILLEKAGPALAERFQSAAAVYLAAAAEQFEQPAERARLMEISQHALVPVDVSPRRVFTAKVVYSPDGRFLVSAGRADGLIHVWNAANGSLERVLRGHAQNALNQANVQRADWRLETVLRGHTGNALAAGRWSTVSAFAFAAERPNEILSAGVDGSIRIWSLNSAELVRQFPNSILVQAAPLLAIDLERGRESGSGRRIVTGDADGKLTWRDSESFASHKEITAHRGPVNAVRFRPDGRQCASASNDGAVRLWDADGNSVGQLDLPDRAGDKPLEVFDVAYSPDAKRVAAAADGGRVYVWQLAPPRLEHRLEGHGPNVNGDNLVRSLAFLSENRLLSGGADGTIREWDLENGALVRVLGRHEQNIAGAQSVYSLAVNPHRHEVASCGSDFAIRVWDVEAGRQIVQSRGLAVPPDGTTCFRASTARSVFATEKDLLISSGSCLSGGIQVRDVTSFGDPLYFLVDPKENQMDSEQNMSSLAVRADGSRFVAARTNGDLLFWEVAGGPPIVQRKAHRPLVVGEESTGASALAWGHDRDKNLVASAGNDGKLRLWNGTTGEPIGEEWSEADAEVVAKVPAITTDATKFLYFDSNDEHVIAAGRDNVIRMWNIEDHTIAARLSGPHTQAVTALDTSADGEYLASGSGNGLVAVWKLKNRTPIRTIFLPPLMVEDAFGRPVPEPTFSGGPAAPPPLWPPAMVMSLAFAPDSRWLAVVLADGSISLVDLAVGEIVYRTAGHELDKHGAIIVHAHFTKRGELLTSASDGTIRRWDLSPWSRGRRDFADNTRVLRAAASADGSEWAAATFDGFLLRWDRDGDVKQKWKPDKDSVQTVAYSSTPERRLLVVGGFLGTVAVLDQQTGEVLRYFRGPDGQREAKVADAVSAVAVQPRGRLAASTWADGSVDLWDLETGEWKHTFPKTNRKIASMCFDGTGRLLATADYDGKVFIFDVAAKQTLHKDLEGPKTATGLSFAPDSERLVQSGVGFGAAVLLWDVAAGKRIQWLRGHARAPLLADTQVLNVPVVTHDPNRNWLATGGGDGTVRLWNARTLQPIAVISLKHALFPAPRPGADPLTLTSDSTIHALAFSSDGNELMVGGTFGSVAVFDLREIDRSVERPIAEFTSDIRNATGLHLDSGWLAPRPSNRLQRE